MVVHAEQIKVKVAGENESATTNTTTDVYDTKLKFDLQTTIGIYVSRECSDAIEEYQEQTKDKKIAINKICNITSSRRMISAIHNLHEWPQYRSLLKPTTNDPYFQLPEDYNPSNVFPTYGFNMAQSKTIAIADCMFEDLQDHLHLVHGPPGI